MAMMHPRYSELRAQLAQRLKAVLGKPQVESKELMAFDLLVNRRNFLKGAEKLAALTVLVNTGLVPTAWGQVNPDIKVSPQQVGLTTSDDSAVTFTRAGLVALIEEAEGGGVSATFIRDLTVGGGHLGFCGAVARLVIEPQDRHFQRSQDSRP